MASGTSRGDHGRPSFAQGIEWIVVHGAPVHVYLTNRHHYRHSVRFTARYGAQVGCHKYGPHEFTHGEVIAPSPRCLNPDHRRLRFVA